MIPSLLLCAVLGANNLSTCLGTSIGSRRLRYSQALALASIGTMGGILLEGSKLSHVITSAIVSSTDPQFATIVTLSTLTVMIFLTYRKLPISLSQVAVGAALGAALAAGIDVNWRFALLIALSWILTPVVGFAFANLLSRLARRIGKEVRGVFTQNIMYSYLTIVSGLYASYALGANTVGLILGMILFSRGTTFSVAENIVGLNPSASFASQMGGAAAVHGFTELGIPVSMPQAVVGGIFGAAFQRKIVVRNDRLIREIVLGWTAAPLLGAVLAIAVSAIL